nr:hypothetical protein [Tanacetum cinerariifolium]
MDFGSKIPTDGPTTVEMVNATKESFDEDDLAKFQELLLDAEKPLYKGCPDFTKLSVIVKLLNLKGKYGASDKFFTELLRLLKKMLPDGNEMVEKTHQAKKLIRMIGSRYKQIHLCSNNCILYWKDKKKLTVCSTYRISRWKVDNKTHKVYENISAKEDNKWCFTSPYRFTGMASIDEKFLEIAKDLRNLWLGISADGVEVNLGTRHHNVWPILSAIYNLPPWLCMKRKFIMLSVLISGYPGNDIDVFLDLLVNDLHTLFETGDDTYDASIKENFNLLQHIENKWGKGKRTNNKTSGNQKDTRGKGRKIQKQKRKTTEEEGSSNKVNKAYWKKFNIWYKKLRYWRHNYVPHCIDFMHVENNVCEGLVETLLNVLGKTKDGMNARLDLAELGIKPELNRPEGCITEETIAKETIEFFSEYHKTMKTIGIPPDKHVTNENEDGKPLSAGKSSEVFGEVFQKAHLLRERELAISKDSVSETVRWIPYGPRATIVKYEAYNINRYTFRMKSNNGIVYQNNGVSVGAVDLHISKEVATIRKSFYYRVLQEIWVLDYRFKQIPLFKCDWVNHKASGVKRDPNLGYTLVDLNSFGHKDDPFILASQARHVFYVKDQIDKKLSIVFRTPTKNYKDTYDEVDEEFSTVIHEHNDNILLRVNRRDLGNESQNDYY